MATIRLVPSTYAVSNSSYVTAANTSNMYTNTDSTTSGTFTHTRASTNSTYYAYLGGFNFSDVPSNAEVSGFTVKIKASATGHTTSTSTSYYMSLYNNTTAIGSTYASGRLSTTTTTFTFANGSLTWDTIVGYGSNFRIRIPLRRASSNTSDVVTVYGAEIEVTYTIPNPVNVSSIIVSGDGTISPSGTTTTYEGQEYTLTITPTDTSEEVTLTNNGADVTSSLVAHYPGGTVDTVLGTYTLVSGSFNGSGATYFQGIVGNSHTATQTTSNYYSGGSSTIAVFTYATPFTNIPSNATIDRVYALVNGHAESTSQPSEYMCAQIVYGSSNTALSEELNFKAVGTSNSTQTIECTTLPTVAQLAELKLQCRLGYYGGAINGATVYVEYSVAGSGDPEYYTYSFTVGSSAVTLEVTIGSAGPYIPDPEDPTKTYYSLTISSINATTSIDGDTVTGTTRVEEGTDTTITITPSDPLLTLALDNGNDITSQLVSHMPSNTYEVTTQVSGASYGFPLNSSTGYYTSNNNGISQSAAVARVNFTFESACNVTISYINYAEATYDYGIFGQVDTALGTTYSADSGAYHTCSASSDNTSSVQTLTYTIPAGSHYIDIKYRKDQATDSNNDNLQWKITSVEPTSGAGYYEYALNDIDAKHSLIFIFGNVSYYFITSTYAGEGRIFPDGQQVVLEGNSYRINIVPDDYQATVTMTDNGTDVTSQLEVTTGQDKDGNTVTSYKYSLSNIQTAHNLVVSIGGASAKLYLKINGTWIQYSKLYKKINGAWIEQADISSVLNTETNYKKGDE